MAARDVTGELLQVLEALDDVVLHPRAAIDAVEDDFRRGLHVLLARRALDWRWLCSGWPLGRRRLQRRIVVSRAGGAARRGGVPAHGLVRPRGAALLLLLGLPGGRLRLVGPQGGVVVRQGAQGGSQGGGNSYCDQSLGHG